MPIDSFSVYSSIKPDLMKRTLLRGTLIASLGMAPMVYSLLHIGPGALSHWGAILFFAGLLLIAIGMVPYRYLTSLERNPHKVSLFHNLGLVYFHKGKKTLTIPFSAIETITYKEAGQNYGIAIHLKKNPADKVVVNNPLFDMEKYQRLNQRLFGCDLFLQYFTRRSFDQIEEAIAADQMPD